MSRSKTTSRSMTATAQFEQLEGRRMMAGTVGPELSLLSATAAATTADAKQPIATQLAISVEQASVRADRTISIHATATGFEGTGGRINYGYVTLEDETRGTLPTTGFEVRFNREGKTTFVLSGLEPGHYRVRAVYQGHAWAYAEPLAGSTSGWVEFDVTPAELTVAPAMKVKFVTHGSNRAPGTLTAYFGEPGKPMPTGRVAFYGTGELGSFLGWADIDYLGRASIYYNAGNEYGSQSSVTVYGGDANYAATSFKTGHSINYYNSMPEGQTRLFFRPDADGVGGELIAQIERKTNSMHAAFYREPTGAVAFRLGDTLLGFGYVGEGRVARLRVETTPPDLAMLSATHAGDTMVGESSTTGALLARQISFRQETDDGHNYVDSGTDLGFFVGGLGKITGSFTLYDGDRLVTRFDGDPATVNNHLVFRNQPFGAGTRTFRLVYSGDANHDPAEFTGTVHVKGLLRYGAYPKRVDERRYGVGFEGVNGLMPSGNVEFEIPSLGWRSSGTIVNGLAVPTDPLPTIPVGQRVWFYWRYAGDATFAGREAGLEIGDDVNPRTGTGTGSGGGTGSGTGTPPAGDPQPTPDEQPVGQTPPIALNDSDLLVRGDFDGDGVGDQLFRHQGRLKVLRTTPGGVRTPSTVAHTTLPMVKDEWQVVAANDFNGDGTDDLVFRNALTNRVAVWFVKDLNVTAQQQVRAAAPAAGWRLTGADDFNGDGKADLVWRNDQTGKASVWFMNATSVRGFGMFNHAPRDTAWTIDRIEDVNGDGHADLVWKNAKTGKTFTWLMHRTNVIGSRA